MARICVKLTKSPIGATEKMKKNLQSLGLKKLQSQVVHEDTDKIQGMIRVVRHLVTVEDAGE